MRSCCSLRGVFHNIPLPCLHFIEIRVEAFLFHPLDVLLQRLSLDSEWKTCGTPALPVPYGTRDAEGHVAHAQRSREARRDQQSPRAWHHVLLVNASGAATLQRHGRNGALLHSRPPLPLSAAPIRPPIKKHVHKPERTNSLRASAHDLCSRMPRYEPIQCTLGTSTPTSAFSTSFSSDRRHPSKHA